MNELAQVLHAAQGNPLVAMVITFATGAAFWRFLDGILSRRAAWDGRRLDEFGEIRKELRERIRELEEDSDKYRDLYFKERGSHSETKQQLSMTSAQLELLRAKLEIENVREQSRQGTAQDTRQEGSDV